MRVNSFVKRAATLVFGSAAAQAITLLALPLLTRIYTPSDFGYFAQYLSIVGILSSFACLRFDDAVYSTSNRRQLKAALGVGMLAAGSCGALFFLVSIVFLLFAESISIELSHSPIFIFAVVFGALIQATYVLLSNCAVKVSLVALLAKNNTLRSTGIVSFQGGLSFTPLQHVGLILGDFLGKCMGLLTLYKRLNLHLEGYRFNWVSMRLSFRKNIRYVKISTPNALINVFAGQLPILFLVYTYNYEIAGAYLMAQRFVGAPLALVSRSIAQAYSSELTSYLSQGKDKLRSRYRNTAFNIFKIAFIPVAVVGLLAPYTSGFMLGNEWEEVGYYIAALCPMLLAQISITSLSNTANIMGKQELLLMWDILRITLVLGVFVLSEWLFLTPLECITFFSAVMVVAFFIQFLMILWHLSLCKAKAT